MRRVAGGDGIHDVDIVGQCLKAVGETDGDICNAKIPFAQFHGMPLQKRGRIPSHIDKDIPDRPPRAADDFDFTVWRMLEMHSADRSKSPGPGMVHLHELGRQAVTSIRRLTKMPDEKATVIPSWVQIDHE